MQWYSICQKQLYCICLRTQQLRLCLACPRQIWLTINRCGMCKRPCHRQDNIRQLRRILEFKARRAGLQQWQLQTMTAERLSRQTRLTEFLKITIESSTLFCVRIAHPCRSNTPQLPWYWFTWWGLWVKEHPHEYWQSEFSIKTLYCSHDQCHSLHSSVLQMWLAGVFIQ